jgi:hypothetical protein
MYQTIKLRMDIVYLSLISAIVLLSHFDSRATGLTQTVRGKITDADSKSPVIGANVIVLESDPLLGSSTNLSGNFKIEEVAVGRISLKVTCIGYEEKLISNILLNSAKEMVLEIELRESIVNMEELVILGSEQNKNEALNDMAVVSARQFSVEETKRFAGAFNDPARMVSAFAGNNTAAEGDNFIIVRGNSPKGIQWRLEGIEIPNPNHFADEGSTGGPINALNSAMLSNSDFFSGAFPAEYGNAFSGVFDMRLRNGNNQEREYTISVGVLGTDVTLEGPFKKDGGASYLVNYRYSTLALLDNLNIVDFGGVPKYQDLSFKLRFPTRDFGTFSVFGLGGRSNIHEEVLDEENPDKILEKGDWKADMGVVGINHQFIFSGNTYLQSNISVSESGNGGLGMELDGYDNFRVYYDGYFRNYTAKLMSTLHHKFNAKNKMLFGMIYDRKFYDYYSDVFHHYVEGLVREQDSNGDTGLFHMFASGRSRFSENLTAIAGVHLMRSEANKNVSVEPRIGLQWSFTPTQSLSAAFGIHSKMESLINYHAINNDDSQPVRYNQDLDFSRATHYVLGYKNSIGENLHLKAEVYYQDLYNIPVEDDPNSSYSLLNSVEGYTTKNLVNDGEGFNYGLELTLERYFSDNYYFMISSSLFESKYRAMDWIWRDTRFNVNYLGNVLFGREFLLSRKENKNKVLSVNARFSIAGGRRYTPIDLEASRAAGYTKREESLAFTEKSDDVFVGNLAVTYRIDSQHTSQEIKLDIQNFTNHAARLEYYYNANTDKIDFYTQLPLLPVLMYTIHF